MIFQADAVDLSRLDDESVDLVFGSPPYGTARDLGIGADRKCDEWVDWMLKVTREALRVTRGAVLWVASGVGNYDPLCEGLIWEGRKLGFKVLRPCIWTKNAAPNNCGTYFSNCWEFVVGFARKMPLPYFDVSEIATPLRYRAGGKFRQRRKDGSRTDGSAYPEHAIRKTMPNVVAVTVGGGHLGSELAHENEAPFPKKLAEYFVPPLCPPGGTVLDPFCGSGTTAAAAIKTGRNFIASDIRPCQVALTERRGAEARAELAAAETGG